MWVILTYDVGVKRNSKVLKICRKYLIHMQKSVFEGEITKKNLVMLKKELSRVIDTECDQIAIYQYDTLRYSRKDTIGYQTYVSNII